MYSDISADQLKQWLTQHPDEVIVIDVRTPVEHASVSIPGSLSLPLSEISPSTLSPLVNPDKKIVLYCRSGGRSATAARMLASHGYQKLYNLEGGILSW